MIIILLIVPFWPFNAGQPSFENGADEITVSLSSPGFEESAALVVPADHYVSAATINVTGMADEGNSSAYPEEVSVQANDTTLWAFNGIGYGPLGRQDRFSTEAAQVKMDFGNEGGIDKAWSRFPKNASITDARLQINGNLPPMDGLVLANFTGMSIQESLGEAVSGAGDVNGDGFDDIIVGAPYNNIAGFLSGRAYIYFGGPTINATPDVTFADGAIYDNFGVSVSGAGDVNGDGYDDVVVGAIWNGAGGSGAGAAYIYFGGAQMDNVPDVIFIGEAPGDHLGDSVAGAGDVNHDGFDDVVVGAYYNAASGGNAGRAYIYFGGADMDSVADVVLTGEAAGDMFGCSVAAAGDLNNDGFDDVIVGAPYNGAGGNGAGRAYIFLGGKSMDDKADVVFTGDVELNDFGFAVSGAGDVNRDGYDDVIISSPYNDDGGDNAGRAFVFYGGQSMDSTADVVLTGDIAEGFFGWSVSGAGDMNNDGSSDIIVGTNQADRAYVFFGDPNMDHTADMVFKAETAGDRLGWAVSNAGDVDKNGFDDVIVGAFMSDAGGPDSGRAIVYYFNDSLLNVLKTGITVGSTTIWSSMAPFNSTAPSAVFTQALNGYLRNASSTGTDGFGNEYVNVPFSASMQGFGNLTLFNLRVEYLYTATTLDFTHLLNDYLVAHRGEKDAQGNIHVPVKVSSSSAGRVRLSGLNLVRDQPPSQIKPIGPLEMDEDTAVVQLLDLYQYFRDDVDPVRSLNFSLASSTNSTFVRLWISGNRYLSADAMTGDANDNWTGTVEAVVECSDGWGHTTRSDDILIVIRNINDPPVITSNPPSVAEAGAVYHYNLTAVDGDSDVLEFSLVIAPAGTTIDPRTGAIEWMPRAHGIFNFTVAVSDGNATVMQNFSLSVANKPPRITSVPPPSALTGVQYVYNVTAEDSNLDVLTFSLSSNISAMGIDAMTGAIRWTPVDVGDYDVAVKVSDGMAADEQDFTVKVALGDRAPKFVSAPVTTAHVGVKYGYDARAEDADGDGLAYALAAGPAGMTVDQESGAVGWMPVAAGNFTVTLNVSDGRGGSDVQQFTVQVLERVKPKVEFTTPMEGQKLGGKFKMTGKAEAGTLEVTKVEVSLDSGQWVAAAGNSSWSFVLDTSKLGNGRHIIQARAFDGMDYSDIMNRTVTVDNQGGKGGGFIPGFNGPVLAATLALAAVLYLRRRE